MIEALKQWAFTLVITAVVGSIAMSVTVSENGKNIKKYIKFACSLVALAVMISPIHGLFQDLPSLFNANGAIAQGQTAADSSGNSDDIKKMNDILTEETQELLKDRISSSIYQKTGIKPENIYIYIKQNDNTNTDPQVQTEIDIDKVEVYMPENTGENEAKEIEEYLKGLLNCDVFVNISNTAIQ
ncbi:MAG: stage III sporulation protein AF [Oscillospiraceae bacterium]|nr:stage III sporulation protein AF [Oscillospiraceae bacterium]